MSLQYHRITSFPGGAMTLTVHLEPDLSKGDAGFIGCPLLQIQLSNYKPAYT